MAEHNLFGKEAENRATQFLKDKGYEILERNWKFRKAEIDIIATDPKTGEIVIAEVKSRHENPLIEPELAVDKKKRALLVGAADQYIVSNEIESDCRFDIITLEKIKGDWLIIHLEDAFTAFD